MKIKERLCKVLSQEAERDEVDFQYYSSMKREILKANERFVAKYLKHRLEQAKIIGSLLKKYPEALKEDWILEFVILLLQEKSKEAKEALLQIFPLEILEKIYDLTEVEE